MNQRETTRLRVESTGIRDLAIMLPTTGPMDYGELLTTRVRYVFLVGHGSVFIGSVYTVMFRKVDCVCYNPPNLSILRHPLISFNKTIFSTNVKLWHGYSGKTYCDCEP